MDRRGKINDLGRQYIGECPFPCTSHASYASSNAFIFWIFIVIKGRASGLDTRNDAADACEGSPTERAQTGHFVDRIVKNVLQVRAEGQQTAVTILYYELSRLPWHVAQVPREFHAVGRVLGIERVCIFDRKVCVQQLASIFIWIRGRRRSLICPDLWSFWYYHISRW